jgi:hypothetical protein
MVQSATQSTEMLMMDSTDEVFDVLEDRLRVLKSNYTAICVEIEKRVHNYLT